MKYLVMECHPAYAVVLDEEGRFLKVANLRYEVGQTVTDVVEMKPPQTTTAKKPKNRWLGSLAAMAACLALVVTSVVQMNQSPYASVYMAINPEVRIDVNRKDVVVGLEGVNADGEDLIDGYHHKKKDLELVMDELVDRAIDMGYLHEGGKITLTLDAENEEWIVSHDDELTAQLIEHLSEKISVTIEVTSQTSTQHSVTIPVDPGSSDYSEEDYGETVPSGSGTENDGAAPEVGLPITDFSYEDGETDYGLDDDPDDTSGDNDGQTDYDDERADDDGQSAYGAGSEDDADDGDDIQEPGDDGQVGDEDPDEQDDTREPDDDREDAADGSQDDDSGDVNDTDASSDDVSVDNDVSSGDGLSGDDAASPDDDDGSTSSDSSGDDDASSDDVSADDNVSSGNDLPENDDASPGDDDGSPSDDSSDDDDASSTDDTSDDDDSSPNDAASDDEDES